MKNLTLPKSNVTDNDILIEKVAKQYENQGVSFSKLLEIGNRGLEKAEVRTQGLKSEEKKISQTVWFIRQEILHEIEVLETKTTQAQAFLDSVADSKKAILEQYL